MSDDSTTDCSLDCGDMFNCCDCGLRDDGCGCGYCFACNACDACYDGSSGD